MIDKTNLYGMSERVGFEGDFLKNRSESINLDPGHKYRGVVVKSEGWVVFNRGRFQDQDQVTFLRSKLIFSEIRCRFLRSISHFLTIVAYFQLQDRTTLFQDRGQNFLKTE